MTYNTFGNRTDTAISSMLTEMCGRDLYRGCTGVEREHLTGESTAKGQRAWCDLNDVAYGCRAGADECSIWLDERVDSLLRGFRDPTVGSAGALPPSCPLAAA